ncbi:endonuclease/exonuclease/phosphatase family protein [Kitasatospora phosalacinea]|uniref:endonuclease/exonuclease/phosphatase family protein n=1 Tax=Kitasatospora phosalacinea TaxID=2065 RepID=UPI00069124B0|nr:endonuclease/exonuclease/phosphatase family protein [Kitasatospora phosalacinea]
MSMEAALLESRTLRSGLCERTEVLDEVKALVLLPDGLYATTRMVADYFEVGEPALYSLLRRHRQELESNGYTVLKPVDNPVNQTFKTNGWQVSGTEGGGGAPYAPTPSAGDFRPQGGGNGVALYSRRAVLNVAMLLRDSEVARRVRGRLLDAVEAAARPVVVPPVVHAFRGRPWRRWSELRWDEYEAGRRDPAVAAWQRRIDGLEPFGAYPPGEDGPVVPPYVEEPEVAFTAEDLPALVAGLVVSVGSVERRLDAHGVLITAIGERISRQESRLDSVDARLDGMGARQDALAEDVRAIRRDVAHLRRRRRR